MLDFNFYLVTPRLFVSHFNPANDAHCDFVHELFFNTSIARELPPADLEKAKSVGPREMGRKFIADSIDKMEKTGYGRYLISLKPIASPEALLPQENEAAFSQKHLEPIGVVSMQLGRFPSAPTIPDVGFGLLPRYHGKGYATEAAEHLMKYFEGEGGLKQICAFCKPNNEGSKAVLRRLKFDERGLRELDGVVKGEKLKALVWTRGVGWEKGLLERYGL
ncbi:ribosomal-protein-alanine acetyltransferase [Stemphylium lycopersici]|nr:ribosomal-protein-alanine acetyltransferase [Stemphylium lycopersici]